MRSVAFAVLSLPWIFEKVLQEASLLFCSVHFAESFSNSRTHDSRVITFDQSETPTFTVVICRLQKLVSRHRRSCEESALGPTGTVKTIVIAA